MRSDEKTKRTPKKAERVLSACHFGRRLFFTQHHTSLNLCCRRVGITAVVCTCATSTHNTTSKRAGSSSCFMLPWASGQLFSIGCEENEGEYSRHQSDGDASGMLGPCPPVHEDEDVVIIAQAGAHYAETTRVVDRYFMTIMVFRVPVSDNTHLGTPNFKASDHRMACTTAKHTTTVFSMEDSLM